MGTKLIGYLPQDKPKIGATLSLAIQQVLTMFPATVLVAILTKFDIGVTLLTSGLGTIIALLVSKKKIPMYYGSSFSYITIIIAAMSMYAPGCFNDSNSFYCASGVQIVQVGIILTAVFELIIGLIIKKTGRASLDKILPPVVTGGVSVVIGIALAGTAISMASTNWLVAGITLMATILFSHYLRGKGLVGMLPILLGASIGYLFSTILGLVDFSIVQSAEWLRTPNITLPAFGDPRAWGIGLSIALAAIATIPESTAHLYQMSLYIDKLADELKQRPLKIKNLIGLNLIADATQDFVAGLLGGCPGTNYGENNSLMAITRNYSSFVLMVSGAIAICLAFVGKLSAIINTIPTAVTGGLAVYLFGVIGMQGIALIQSEKVDLFEPKQLAIGATILITGIGGNLGLPNGMFPFNIPLIFPDGIPAIVLASILGITLNFVLKEDRKKIS
jgi:uracil permease